MKKAFTWILEKLPEYGLKITLWSIVACCFVALATKAIWGKPSSAPFDNLLIIAAVAATLAVLLPNLAQYLLNKITEIEFGGVKMVIAKAKEIREEIKFKEIPPASMTSADATDRPLPYIKLKGSQLYEYERLSHKLYQTFDEIKDPNDLSADLRENYRELLKHIGKMAFSVGHFSKYFDIVSHLKLFKDRELDADELYEIGNAYLWAADEQFEVAAKEKYWKEAIKYLVDSVKKNQYEIKAQFNLGLVFLYSGLNDRGIYRMRKCIRLDQSIAPWAKWNIACGYIKQNKPTETLTVLEEIEKGVWWEGIKIDADLTASSTPATFRASFDALCDQKLLP